MEVAMVFKLVYDRHADGSLADFKVKYDRFKDHITRMQTNGSLPVGDIKWSIEHKKPPQGGPPLPCGPAMVAQFMPAAIVHVAGRRLDTERIAM